MSDRDKFLTEAMGECWHQRQRHGTYLYYKNNYISTWQGFGKLWEWAEDQKWWDEFVDKDLVSRGHKPWLFPLGWINPNNFANALYEFLKGEVDDES